jgi:hypothetical protein
VSEPVWGVLTRAADRLTELAAGATPGPWVAYDDLGLRSIRSAAESPVCTDAEPSHDWIAALSPVVAAPLIEWLRYSAAMWRMYEGRDWPEEKVRARVSTADLAAEKLARGVLGEEQP